MKDNISNIFSIHNKNLILEKTHSYENLFLFNDDFCFNCELENNTVNLEEFILMNEFMLLPENIFYLGTKKNGEGLTPIKAIDRENETICSKLKITSSKHDYYLNIYYNSDNYLKVSIKRVYEEIKTIDIHSVFLDNNNKLNINISTSSEEMISEAGIVLFSKECKMIPFSVDEVVNNDAIFRLNLNALSEDCNKIFKSNLILNGKIYPLDLERAFFHTSILSKNGIYNDVSIFSGNEGVLTLIKQDHVTLNTYLENAYISDNKLNILINISSNLDTLNQDLFDITLTFAEHDYMLEAIENIDNIVKFEISLDDITELRNLYNPKLKLQLHINSKESDKEYTENIVCENLNLNIKGHILCPVSSTIPVNIYSAEKETYLNVCNPIEIKALKYIKTKKNSLEMQFRTHNDIEDIKTKLSIIINDIELEAQSIKKYDKNTLICNFKIDAAANVDPSFDTVNSILDSGLTVKTSLGEKEYIQSLSNLDNVDIINNAKEPLTDFNKPKQACMHAYKKIFSKLTDKKKATSKHSRGDKEQC